MKNYLAILLISLLSNQNTYGAAGDIRLMQKDPTNISFFARDLPLPGTHAVFGFNNNTNLPQYFKLGSTLGFNGSTNEINVGTVPANNVSGLATVAMTGSFTDLINAPTPIPGPPGATGATGTQGPKGDMGDVGPQGPIGLTGPAGSIGATGAQGIKGDKGDTGDIGPQGPIGLTGAQGATGNAGIQGPKGDTGLQGPIGLTGPIGATGSQGPKGDQGDIGPQGIQGATGTQGIKGDTGAQGPIGLTGATGSQGPKGDIGLTGPTGATGATGPAGVVAATSPLAYNSGTQTVSIQTASSSQDGAISAMSYTTFNNKFGSVTYTPSVSTRNLNTNFSPSSSNAVMACYSINLTCSLTLAGTCTGQVELRSDTNSTPTTVRGTIANNLTLGLGIVVATTAGGPQQICYLVPPGHNVRLVSSGTITPTIVSQSEVSIGFGQ